MSLSIGQTAPEFSLYDTEKNKVSLSTFKGQPVLILFFPLAFTSVCTRELCSMRDNIAQYNQLNAKIIAISVDSVYTLAKFKSEQQLNFTLLSDFNKEVSTAYGSLYETFSMEMRGVSKRSAFLVDKEGVIAYAEVLERAADIPNFEAINVALEQIA